MHDLLCGIDEVKSLVSSSLERECTEGVDDDAHESESPKPSVHFAFAHGNEGKQEDGEVVGESIAELDPAAVLVEQIRQSDAHRRERNGPKRRRSSFRPKRPRVDGRRDPKGEAVSVDLKRSCRRSADKRQRTEDNAEVFPKIVIGKQAPFVDASAPSNRQKMMSEFERISETRFVVPSDDGEDGCCGCTKKYETFAQGANVQVIE